VKLPNDADIVAGGSSPADINTDQVITVTSKADLLKFLQAMVMHLCPAAEMADSTIVANACAVGAEYQGAGPVWIAVPEIPACFAPRDVDALLERLAEVPAVKALLARGVQS